MDADVIEKLPQNAVSKKRRAVSSEKVSKALQTGLSQKGWPLGRTFILLGLEFIVIYPLLTILTQAFRPLEEFKNPSVIWLTINPTLDNIKLSWQLLNYTTAFRNSFVLSFFSSLLQLVTCALAGYGFAKFRFKFKGLLFAGVVLTMVIPPQMLFLPMYLQYTFFDFFGISHILGAINNQPYTNYTINLLNSPMTFFIPSAFGVGLRSGLFIYIFRQFFRNIPQELVEAAKIDGCGSFKTFVQIMVPIAKATFATVFLFSVVWHWNETTYTSLFFMKSASRPLSTTLGFVLDDMRFSDLIIHEGYNVAQKKVVAYSGTLLYIAPLIILYIFTQRFFVEGIETTGIKG